MKSIKLFSFLFYIFRFILCKINTNTFFRCGFDDNKATPLPAKNYVLVNEDKRKLDDIDEFKDFHIYLDLVNIKKDIEYYNLKEYEEMFISSLNRAAETLQKLLKVKKLDKGYSFTDEEIKKIEINYWNKTVIGSGATNNIKTLGIDLIIFGRFNESMDESTLASAGMKYYVNETGQPLVGVININLKANYSKINSKNYFESIVLHEFTHILGFSQDQLKTFTHNIFNKVDKYGINRSYINSSKVLKVAKEYFNCTIIDGVELEEYGGSGTVGSHWEARILLGDYMNGIIYPEEQVISEFTLALLEDTGYYKANYYTGGLMRYGKGKGCDFVYNKCVDSSSHEINSFFENEFYDSIFSPSLIDSSCSSGRQSRTYYAFWKYDDIPEKYQYFSNKTDGGYAPADYCPVAKEYSQENEDSYYTGHCSLKGNGKYGSIITYYKEKEYRFNSTHVIRKRINYFNTSEELKQITGETYSDHSFCYQSTLIKNNFNFNTSTIRAICYESFCSNYSLTIKINDDYIVCPRAGGKIQVEGYTGYFMCPDYNLICSGTVMCNDMFDCVDKKSELKENAYIYDYKILTTQNIETFDITFPDETFNYELAENGICPINCKHCQKNNKCLKCRNDYGLFQKKDSEITKCLPLSDLSKGYYQENNIFYECIDKCDKCSNNSVCEQCIEGYVFNNKKCSKKISNCKLYGSDDLCDECIENYYLSHNNRTICSKKLELLIIQVQMIDGHLKIYFTISTEIEKGFSIKIPINLYKNNNIRNNEESSNKIIIELRLKDENDIKPGNILELTSIEKFDENDRIVINNNKDEHNSYDLKVLNNDNKILDTVEIKKMIEKNEIKDFSKDKTNIKINKYNIKSITNGCKFELTTNIEVKEQNKSVVLNFYKIDNSNSDMNIECLLNSDNNNKIYCYLLKELNETNYYFKSYIGSSNEGLFYIIQDCQDFQLICQKEKEKEKEKGKKNNVIIIIIIVAVIIIISIIIISVIYYRKKSKSNLNINVNKTPASNPQNEPNIDISFSGRDEKYQNYKYY